MGQPGISSRGAVGLPASVTRGRKEQQRQPGGPYSQRVRSGADMSNQTRIGAGQRAAETSLAHIDRNNPRWGFNGFRVEKQRCWGPISVDLVDRAAGEAVCRSNCYRLTYFLTDFDATMEDDERPQWECQLLRGNFVFRSPDTTLRSNLTAGRYIQILQSRDTYANLTSEMVRGVSSTSGRYTT